MAAEEGYKVTLNVYDLSQGLARQLSTTFLGKAIEAIWHTGVVVYGNEYYFGGGITHTAAGTTPYGTPMRVVDLGVTHVPQDVFEMYLQEISPRYTAETYSLLQHNCNNFSNEVAQFLVGATIPNYILELPNEVMSSPMGALMCKCLSSPMGALMLPMIQQLETTLRSGAAPQVPQFRPPATSQSSIQIPKLPIKVTSTKAPAHKVNSEAPKINEAKTICQTVPPAVKPAAIQDPLGNARNKVQEEINSEFTAIMATGTMRASEAAALATKRVMQRHGHLNATMPQS